MPLISAKCTNCGANLEVDNTKDAAICPYCNTAYVVEKAVNYYNTTNNITANVVNVYGGNSADFVIRAGELVKYNGASTKVYIPNTVKIIGEHVFDGCVGLESVVIPDSVTCIQNYAFNKCASLKEIIIPNSVTVIGFSAFDCCNSLTEIVLPDSVVTLEDRAFSECRSLKRVVFSKNLERIGNYAFWGCTALEILVIPSVKFIGGGAFYKCTSLKEVIFPEGVHIAGQSDHSGGAFYGCSSLSKLIFRGDGEVCDRGGAFDYCPIETIDASETWKRNNYRWFDCLSSYAPQSQTNAGCYIATAVYGCYDCPQVWTLRRFRDNTLGVTWCGRAFIRIYYSVSPTLVKLFGHMNWFKKLWRKRLDNMVEKLQKRGVESSPYCDREW